MKIVIQDASVLIDLQTVGLLDPFFRLGWEVHTTDLVVREMRKPLGVYIISGRLRVKGFTGDELAALVISHSTQPKPISIEDCSVLKLSEALGGILLTGDGNLRICGQRAGVQVHGSIWIFDHLIEAGLIEPVAAAESLQRLLDEGSRLPLAVCQGRIRQWRGAKAAIPS